MLNGTPFKSPVWRLAGVRIGRRVFDDGCAIPERTLVTIGDHCTLNAGSVIQCHSMEDGIFKSDRTVLEDGCTLGTGAPGPLRRHHRPGRTAPARLLRDEGREDTTPRTLGRQPRPADAMTRIRQLPWASRASSGLSPSRRSKVPHLAGQRPWRGAPWPLERYIGGVAAGRLRCLAWRTAGRDRQGAAPAGAVGAPGPAA